MKKSQLKQLISSSLIEILFEKDSEHEKLLNMQIKNPETGNDVKLKSALASPKDSQVYKAGKLALSKATDILKDEPKKEPEAEEPEAEEPTSDDPIEKRAAANDKLKQIPKEKLEKFQDADKNYSAAVDSAWRDAESRGGRDHAHGLYKDPGKENFAPEGHEDEYKAYTALAKDASYRTDDEKSAEREKETAAAADKKSSEQGVKDFGRLKPKTQEKWKESEKQIANGNIHQSTLPNIPTDFKKREGRYNEPYNVDPDTGDRSTNNYHPWAEDTDAKKHAEKEYDRLMNKAWEVDKEATTDVMINRMLDAKKDPDYEKRDDLKRTGNAKDSIKLDALTTQVNRDTEILKSKGVSDQDIYNHEQRIKKERDHEKKSGVGKFFSKLGLNEENVKNPLKLKDLIRR